MSWVTFERVAARCAAVFIILALAGCGGGGGGGDDTDGHNNPDPGGGGSIAPSEVAGHALTLQGGASRRIDFADSGNIWTEQRDGVLTGGTYQYRVDGNSAELVLTDSVGDTRLHLTFSSATSGSYQFVSDPFAGSFTLETIQNGGGEPDTGGDPEDDSGLAPGSLDGRILYGTRTFTSTGPVGQTHVYTFTGSAYHDSDPPEESDGAYVYEPSRNRARLTLNYYSPRMFNGDKHIIEMRFQSSTTGTFESIYTRRDGTMIAINGTFRIE